MQNSQNDEDDKELFGLRDMMEFMLKICQNFKKDLEEGKVIRFDMFSGHVDDKRMIYLAELQHIAQGFKTKLRDVSFYFLMCEFRLSINGRSMHYCL